jgi:hypothetical protein
LLNINILCQRRFLNDVYFANVEKGRARPLKNKLNNNVLRTSSEFISETPESVADSLVQFISKYCCSAHNGDVKETFTDACEEGGELAPCKLYVLVIPRDLRMSSANSINVEK